MLQYQHTIRAVQMNGKNKRTKRIEVRLNEREYLLLEQYAQKKGLAMAEVLRDFIKTLENKNN